MISNIYSLVHRSRAFPEFYSLDLYSANDEEEEVIFNLFYNLFLKNKFNIRRTLT